MNSNDKGDISLTSVISFLVKNGVSVCLPITDNKRYDLIMDNNGKLYKMQVKTAKLHNSKAYLDFLACSYRMTSKGNKAKQYTKEEIDGFLIYCFELDAVYLVWINEVEDLKSKVRLRIDKCRNNQENGIRYAQDFVLLNQLCI
ncbi:group I intron-associated PD-(D/E)XK endonuclease [Bacillus alkalicellulosilyticus]|uniref:group I intron-associated PD-(D/E)XK endonuclease n=1 Tax=Alkalihalobacterium alkalicellulosilyticum TaxID=1912214 RepID=UPI00099726DB|nr:group I intron-associated PD-(D/E)XK endonuclease [Bacillus alkalicellulosilyticus]